MEIKKENKETDQLVNQQTKVSIEISISRNFNKVSFGIQDEPIPSATTEEFKEGLKQKAKVLREIADEELKLIGGR